MTAQAYVHGYGEREARRLADQAATLAELLHGDTRYGTGETVLEAGCGTGCQTVILACNSPQARFTSIDLSEPSLEEARAAVEVRGIANVTFRHGDLYRLDFPESSFDHAFICFVLEHLPDPAAALAGLRRVLKPGGTLTAIEGDHGSFYCHPDSVYARRAVDCLIRSQAALGGDALIGRRLYPLLVSAGFRDVRVSPRMVYADASRPEWVEGFSKNTFIAMVEGVRDPSIGAGLIDAAEWDRGIGDLYRATEDDGTFCYAFFKAVAVR